MARRHVLQLFLGVLVVAAVALAACSSFSEADAPPGADGGPDETGSSSGVPPDPAETSTPCDPVDVARLESDPSHCGSCGHSCLGGACVNRACQPFALATVPDEDAIVDVRVDDANVIWTTTEGDPWTAAGQIYLLPKAGGTPKQLLTAKRQMGSLTADGTNKSSYVSFVYGERGIAKLAPDVQPLALSLDDSPSPVRLTVFENALYFLSTFDGPNTSFVARVDGAATAVVAQHADSTLRDVVLTTSGVFVADTSSIFLVASGATPPTTKPVYTKGGSNLHSLATDDRRVFWVTEGGTTQVVSCLSAACESTTPTPVLTAPPGDTLAATTYDHGVLLTTTTGGRLFACPAGDCTKSLAPIVQGAAFFDEEEWRYGHNVAADDVAVYWSEKDGSGGHRVMKLAK